MSAAGVFLASILVVCLLLDVAQAARASAPAKALDVGSRPRPPELQGRLQSALIEKGPEYRPRTEHLTEDGKPLYTNRLILEDSPYLQQHAHNPVDWFAWGPEAFERAKKENKPIFLSIGYSTCHWCHVMEKESFEDPAIASLLNNHFLPIKVDRERRPDVDETYITAVMLISGHGGWPMSSFLTPDGKPFFGGTYYPPRQFALLLERIETLWKEQQPEVEEQAERVAKAVAKVTSGGARSKKLGDEAIHSAVSQILARHDELQGGFSVAPKFPSEPLLYLLLDVAERYHSDAALEAVWTTLDAMARGGIYDQIGGGFHRYSIDNDWLVPHFEKMLYNQAHLARVYLGAWRLTGRPLFERIARQTLDYVLREMTSSDGGFFSATDADSEGEEGRFFLWTPGELRLVLGPDDAKLATELYGVTSEGNFEGRNILHLSAGIRDQARLMGRPYEDLIQRVDVIRDRLRQARDKREHPLRDDKIVTAWNGMMIGAFAVAGDYLRDAEYLAAAKKAADFVWTNNRLKSGELWRVSLNGRASVPAGLEDYAYLAEALILIYDATGDGVWLARAREVADAMSEVFWDRGAGGFFMGRSGDGVPSLGRPKSAGDNAIPSGNSVALRVLAMLAKRTEKFEYSNMAHRLIEAFAEQIERQPSGYAYMLKAADELLRGELGARQYAALGGIRITGTAKAEREVASLQITIGVPEDWHINANEPLQTGLIGTEVSLDDTAGEWRLTSIGYPPPRHKKLGFQEEVLALYEGQIALQGTLSRIKGEKSRGKKTILPLMLRLQACNDKVCLPPETLVLRVPLESQESGF